MGQFNAFIYISADKALALGITPPDQVLCPSRARRSARHTLLLVTLSAVLDVTAISHKCSVLLERV